MCLNLTSTIDGWQRPEIPAIVSFAAKAMVPEERQELAIEALAGTFTITELSEQFGVSRKFVYQQRDTAIEALEEAFAPVDADDDAVLFHLPVTKSWLQQMILGLVLVCRSSFRGVVEFSRDLLDYPLSVGTVHNVVQAAVATARAHNLGQDLAGVRIGAHDEIFQVGMPVLVGVDVFSTYCYLLSPEEHRDGDTWGVRVLELMDRNFAPEATIGDAGSGLRSGLAQALPVEVCCRSDAFHASQEATLVVTFLENRSFDAIAACEKLERQQAKLARNGRSIKTVAGKLRQARIVQNQAIDLADDVNLLVRWLRLDVLGVNGLTHADRQHLYDFILAELSDRAPACPHRLPPLIRYLQNQRDDLLAFAVQLDRDLANLASQFEVAPQLVRELFVVQTLPDDSCQRYRREAVLRRQLRERYFPLSQAVEHVRRHIVRASSVVENLNSRLRGYFSLRRHIGPDYLALLQFFLNHRRFLRSEHPERVGKSPTELLTGQRHHHWLAMLGYQQFSRN